MFPSLYEKIREAAVRLEEQLKEAKSHAEDNNEPEIDKAVEVLGRFGRSSAAQGSSHSSGL